ncbi:MAG: discoidin domain-containing protein [Phycisphaerae bacterium]|nr:discoidin domain-containing protein [Phycisphaerae bacterium]HON93347.1 discoidin domain-containing protein [Sedimentisphaerales bacterium]
MRRTPLHSTCLLLGLALASLAMAAEPFQQDGGPDGLVCVEAEHYDNKVDIGTNTWSLVTTAAGFTGADGFSGGYAMQIMPDTPAGGRSVNTGYAANSPRLDFQINFVKTGIHYVWILGFGRDGNADSAHAGLNGLEIATCDRMSGWQGTYNWSRTTLDGAPSSFEITQTGIHTLNIYMREDGMVFDKILLTTSDAYTPTGHGPAESPRGVPAYATGPVPSDLATDVRRETSLSWTPGPSATAHDVYFGASQTDVAEATRTDPRGVLVSQAQDANAYDPPTRLELGTTYYWRIDEVGPTTVKGYVWSFTTEPFTYRVTGIAATASSSDLGMVPENTVNNSGMNATGGHSTLNTAMWLSSKTGPQPAWIQYEFDRVYKLHEMHVWNYNVMFESVLGFGFKGMLVEYSQDGAAWTTLVETQIPQAPGQENYAAGAVVDFAGTPARYVRLTGLSNWGGLAPQFGLSEVRFYYLPVSPREPRPPSGATGVDVDTTLIWRAGREAGSHDVYFSTDQQAVADGTAPMKSVAEARFDPGPLTLGTTYYWKVAEVNESETPAVWQSDLWRFTTKEYLVVDDFESYTDDEGSRIYETWIDGLTTKASGSTVGYIEAPFAERTIVRSGKQSMPFEYNNVATPHYSEGDRQWDSAQDWTVHGADTLTLFFRGNPVDFVEPAPGSVTMSAGGADIWNSADEFRFAFKQLNGNGTLVAKVESLDNTNEWAKAGVMIREDLTAGSRFAAVYATPGQGVRYQARLISLGAATSDTAIATDEQKALKIPVWIKIERSGTSFNCFYSTDGTKWTAMTWNPQSINLSSTVYIGLAVTSHNTAAMATAQYSNISFTGTVTGNWSVATIGPAQPTNDAAPLYVTVKDGAGKSKTVVHPDPSATLLSTWQEWRIPLSEFTAGGVKMNNVRQLTIGVGSRTNPTPGATGLLYIDDIGFGRPLQ